MRKHDAAVGGGGGEGQLLSFLAPEGDTDLNSGGFCREQQGAEDPGSEGLTRHHSLAAGALGF